MAAPYKPYQSRPYQSNYYGRPRYAPSDKNSDTNIPHQSGPNNYDRPRQQYAHNESSDKNIQTTKPNNFDRSQYAHESDKSNSAVPYQPNSYDRQRQYAYDDPYETDKSILIAYLYESVDFTKYKFKVLEYEHDLSLLKDTKYYVSPTYSGSSSLLVFVKLSGKYYSYFVDRKSIPVNRAMLDTSHVKLYRANIQLDDQIYNESGTVFEGMTIYDPVERIKHFIITDVFLFKGKNTTTYKINDKMLNISAYISSNFKNTQRIHISVNKLCDLSAIKTLINTEIPKSKYSKYIKGVSFYSEQTGSKLIYMFNNCSDNKYDANPPNKAIRKSNIDVTNSTIGVFRIKKTDTTDVYKLYTASKTTIDDKTALKYEYHSDAYLPTIDSSHFCRDVLASVDHCFVECKYCLDKNKWIPFKMSENKRASYLDEIESIMNAKK